MFIERYILAENPPSMPGPGLIICRDKPHWIGKVVQFKEEDELASFKINSINADKFFQCPGYRIGILVFDKLEATEKNNLFDEVGEQMALYYFNNKILPSATYYRRYKS